MYVGQSETFTATPSGGTGTLSYQWYLDGVAVGTNNVSYSYIASGTSHSVTCTVTDSASVPVTSAVSNAVSVTVNQLAITVIQGANGLISPGTITVNYGATSSFTITPVNGYHIVAVLVGNVSQGAVSSYTFSNVTTNCSITASFAINTPTPTPTTTPTPTSTPTTKIDLTVPEFPMQSLIIALVVSMISVLAAVIVTKKRMLGKTNVFQTISLLQ